MKFKAESELVETLKDTISSSFSRDHVRIFEEVSLGYGIADIVISDCKALPENDQKCISILDHNDINIYSIIENSQGISITDIIDIVRSPKAAVNKSLNKLRLRGFISEDAGLYMYQCKYEHRSKSNFAIEAKLKDWKRALKQAYRYKWFAEYSYVVLDAHYSKTALKNIHVFVKHNVGLASINVDGTLLRHYNPSRQTPLDPKMQILFSEKMLTYELAK